MQTANLPASSSTGDAALTLVMLCRDLERRVAGLDLDELGRWLSERLTNTVVLAQDDLCQRFTSAGDTIQRSAAQRLVLALCSNKYREAEVQALARKVGLDPLGLQTIDLEAQCGGAQAFGQERAKVILAGSVARAQAFPGSRPENLKAVLRSRGHLVSRRALFTLPPITYVSAPTIDAQLCVAEVGCDLCVEACPAGALQEQGTAILVDRGRCQACGLCVAACPQRAVEFPGWSPAEIETQVAALLEADAGLSQRAILFTCKGVQAPQGSPWLPVPVPCVGMVPVAAMLQALAQGAVGVALSSCGEGCPTAGPEIAQGRVDYCRQVLTSLGDSPKRMRLLEPGDASDSELLAPEHHLDGQNAAGPLQFFGAGASATALEALAARHAYDGSLFLEHPYSPLGAAQISPAACTGCVTCVGACTTGALTREEQPDGIAIVFDPRMCNGCGRCASVCPEKDAGAIAVSRTTDLALLSRGKIALYEDQEVRCQKCGAPVASRGVLNRIAAILKEDYNPRLMEQYCADCRGLVFQ